MSLIPFFLSPSNLVLLVLILNERQNLVISFLLYSQVDSGLFRVPGSTVTLDMWQNDFNQGRGYQIDFLQCEAPPEDVASLLKKFLRDSPDIPLLSLPSERVCPRTLFPFLPHMGFLS